MIVNIRGTGGAGKTHLVKRIMGYYMIKQPYFMERRARPLYYVCTRPGGNGLFIPGHYETPTGGCDTIQMPDDVYTLVKSGAEKGHDVLFEGIMIGDDVRRCAALNKEYKTVVIALTTPVSECIAGIQQRRDARGDERELNPKNTVARANRLRTSMMPRLKIAGVECHWLDREQAFEKVKELLVI